MKLIGILGGTFNPIHIGHLRLAQVLAESLKLDTVKFIPSAQPPHKTVPQVSAEHRAAMVALAIQNNPTFSLESCELLRTGNSYTIETLEYLRQLHGEDAGLVLLMGSDAFTKLNTWHRWADIIQYCHIALAQRPLSQAATNNTALDKQLETLLQNHYTENSDDLYSTNAGFITMQAMTPLAISSTEIRAMLENKQSARYLLPDAVLDYIDTHQLYDTP